MNEAIPRRRLAMARLLIHEAGGDASSSEEFAAAAGRLLERFSGRLSPVIGASGVEALLLRAVKLCKADFPFLDERMLVGDSEGAGDSLRARLRAQETKAIRESSVSLFATLVGLLATFVGDRLAWSLVRDVWPETLRSETDFWETEE